jgi:hypothetical protein
MNKDIQHLFDFHPATPEQAQKYDMLRGLLKRAALIIDAECPVSREKSTAIEKLEEAMFWANASIARNTK